ncbi:uncharacterized protein K452DRAFT_279374 [Aplosporella prunicola CBS 121167]|uniref:Uncharacterized protein n=1 Tax=Aplosporella prunicola CBS 121167 TaxID=1176127 RepID=A0A6A6AYX0_9PEZI|nr:uncharacterized protein K452DRAFT_279374 [Aplosporella prunicola CBS 121167]KAF2136816.1 hypothetical protein K452DRAFT_279374 [Aplosporella prunicola CBS 121167]
MARQAVTDSQRELLDSVMSLTNRIRGPTDMLFSHFEHMASIGSLRALMDMGVFEAMPQDETPISAKELAAKCKVDMPILVRLFRAVTPWGPFKETGEMQYAHTEMSKAYLNPGLRAVFTLMVDEFMGPMARIHEFLKRDGFENKLSITHNPYEMYHQTGGKSMFDYLALIPDRFSRFNTSMSAQSSGLATIGTFHFEEELSKITNDEDSVAFVDIGGGKGHVINQIKAATPGLKGKFVLQDRQTVLDDIDHPTPGITRMGHDFFKPQPIKGARAYYFRRIFHDWPDNESRIILKHIVEAMTPGVSRLLLAEMVVPNKGADALAAWMDQCMLSFGGTERTERDWRSLLDSVGLELVKVWPAQGTTMSIVEARLKPN